MNAKVPLTPVCRRERYDVVVIGLGIMGSAIVRRLAQARLRVLGVEQFQPSHALGSSQGQTRLLRRFHFEHPEYTPLAVRAHALWQELERAAGRWLLRQTGALLIGPEEGPLVQGTLNAARSSRLPFRCLKQGTLRASLPGLNLQPEEIGVYEPEAGILFTAACLQALQTAAVASGAQLCFDTRCTLPLPLDGHGPIALEIHGRVVEAERVVVAAGPWTKHVLAHHAPELTVERVVNFWLAPLEARDAFRPERFPVTLWDHPDGPLAIFPEVEDTGVKVAFHHSQQIVDPDEIDRGVKEEEAAALRFRLERAAPGLNGRVLQTHVCMYTNTSDGHFAVGLLPNDRLVLVSACSGHGFKFAPVIAEIVTDLVTTGRTQYPNALFRLDRPALRWPEALELRRP